MKNSHRDSSESMRLRIIKEKVMGPAMTRSMSLVPLKWQRLDLNQTLTFHIRISNNITNSCLTMEISPFSPRRKLQRPLQPSRLTRLLVKKSRHWPWLRSCESLTHEMKIWDLTSKSIPIRARRMVCKSYLMSSSKELAREYHNDSKTTAIRSVSIES